MRFRQIPGRDPIQAKIDSFRIHSNSFLTVIQALNDKTNSVASVRERTTSADRPPLVGEVRTREGCRVVSAKDPQAVISPF
jgi:hypothetical protein